MKSVNRLKRKRIPIKFLDWGDNSEVVNEIYDVFDQGFSIVREDCCRLSKDSVRESLEYYNDSIRDMVNEHKYINLPKNYYPDFTLLETSEKFGYDILKVNDRLALNFMLSCSCGENIVSIFSSEYDVSILSNIWAEYYGNRQAKYKNVKFYEFFCDVQYRFEFKGSALAWLDTYKDDEDSSTFLEVSRSI